MAVATGCGERISLRHRMQPKAFQASIRPCRTRRAFVLCSAIVAIKIGTAFVPLRSSCTTVSPAANLQKRNPRLYPTLRRHAAFEPEEPERTGAIGKCNAFVDGILSYPTALLETENGLELRNLAGRERFESIKAATLSVVSGVIPLVPVAWMDSERFTPRWEFQLDMLALDLALFGLVYRYAVREGDEDWELRNGVLGAFALSRALFMVQLPEDCTSTPLSCGPPLGYFSWDMLTQVAWQLFTGGAALGGALYGLERGFHVGLTRRFYRMTAER